MDDKTTDIATSENQSTIGGIDVASIAARHPTGSSEVKTGKAKRRIKLPDGTYIDREALGALTGKVATTDKPGIVDGPVALSPVAKEQIVAALSSLIKIVDQRVQFSVYRTAERITNDTKFATDLKEQVAMGEAESTTICSLATVVLEKYNILGTYAPEALLAVCCIGYGYRVHSTLRDLKQMKKELEQDGLSTQTAKVVNHGEERERKD